MARKVPFVGSIVAMDRGYSNYKLFPSWTTSGIYFVTRLKDNADYTVIDEHRVPQNRNILSDQLIQFNGYKAKKDCPHILRKVVAWRDEFPVRGRGLRALSQHRTSIKIMQD